MEFFRFYKSNETKIERQNFEFKINTTDSSLLGLLI